MDKDLIWITEYVNSLHQNTDILADNTQKMLKKQINVEKVSLDMKILQQRMDSVSIVKYYKDLKNDRLKSDKNIVYVQNEEDLFQEINDFNDNKPWPKLDNYTKKKKITDFVNKLIIENPVFNKEQISKELLLLLEEKKINKKNIELNDSNHIIKLGQYSLIC